MYAVEAIAIAKTIFVLADIFYIQIYKPINLFVKNEKEKNHEH